jgi:hypothetical protein
VAAQRVNETQPCDGRPLSSIEVAAAQVMHETPSRDGRRYLGLVAATASWQMLQGVRMNVQKPMLAYLRAVGAIEKGDKLSISQLMAKCTTCGVPEWMPIVLADLATGEDVAQKHLVAEFAEHPLAGFADSVAGLGQHNMAVIVGLLDGDPYIAYPQILVGERGSGRLVTGEPYARTLGQLWAYCGYGNPSLHRHEGMSRDDLLALGKPILKARCRVAIEACIKLTGEPDKNGRSKPRSPYRDLYEQARKMYAERTHEAACRYCKGAAGSPWRDGHKHAAALRLTIKKGLLADLYDAAKLLHEWPARTNSAT